MNTDTFTNWLIAAILLMQVVCVLIVVLMWSHFGPLAIVPACILAFILTVLAIRQIRTINVYDKKGKPVTDLNDIVGSVFAAAIWTGVGSVLSIIAGMFLVNHYADLKARNKLIGMMMPFLAVGVFFAGFAFQVKVCK